MYPDCLLMAYVQEAIKSGRKTIELPADLVADANPETLKEVRQLCKLSGVKIVLDE